FVSHETRGTGRGAPRPACRRGPWRGADHGYGRYLCPRGRERPRSRGGAGPLARVCPELPRRDRHGHRSRNVSRRAHLSDGRAAVATCEFSGQLVKVDLATRTVLGYLTLDPGGLDSAAMPQDIRSRADGRVFYVADMRANGVYLVDPDAFRRIGFVATGKGTHGIYPSRDGRQLYVTNRGWNTTAGGRHGPGTITVLDPATERIVAAWPVPRGGSPDMGNVSADGKELWVSGRYDDEVYVFD